MFNRPVVTGLLEHRRRSQPVPAHLVQGVCGKLRSCREDGSEIVSGPERFRLVLLKSHSISL